MLIEDDTDLDAAAKFNIEDWIENSGLNTIGNQSIAEISKFFLQ